MPSKALLYFDYYCWPGALPELPSEEKYGRGGVSSFEGGATMVLAGSVRAGCELSVGPSPDKETAVEGGADTGLLPDIPDAAGGPVLENTGVNAGNVFPVVFGGGITGDFCSTIAGFSISL